MSYAKENQKSTKFIKETAFTVWTVANTTKEFLW